MHFGDSFAVFPSWKLRIRRRGLFDLVDADILRPTGDNTQAERDEHTDELKSVDVYQDNISAISIVQDLVYTGRTKHLDIRLKFVREYVRRGALLLRYLPTRKMLADVLTKGLPARTFKGFATCLCCGGDLPK